MGSPVKDTKTQASYALIRVGLLDSQLPDGSGILLAADSQSLVAGRFGITQLIKRTCSVLGGSTSNWELDGSKKEKGSTHSLVCF